MLTERASWSSQNKKKLAVDSTVWGGGTSTARSTIKLKDTLQHHSERHHSQIYTDFALICSTWSICGGCQASGVCVRTLYSTYFNRSNVNRYPFDWGKYIIYGGEYWRLPQQAMMMISRMLCRRMWVAGNWGVHFRGKAAKDKGTDGRLSISGEEALSDHTGHWQVRQRLYSTCALKQVQRTHWDKTLQRRVASPATDSLS